MIYRIDIQHFLGHAIDYFTPEELTHFQYAIISAAVKNNSKVSNVVKVSELFPLPEIVISYNEHKDKSIMEKMYRDFLLPEADNDMGLTKKHMANVFYNTFINTLINHHDVVIVCDQCENDYIDVICKLLKEHFDIEVIDLNELFTKGRIGPIYIDRKEIWDHAVDIRRAAGDDMRRALESSVDGRMKLLDMMTKKQKIKKLKEIGIDITSTKNEDLNALLMSAWVNDEDD